MPKQTRDKQERIIEAVRHGLEGDAAVQFIRQSGFAMTQAGIARHLRTMGGRGRVLTLINEGKSNIEILQTCFPDDDLTDIAEPPSQGELFLEKGATPSPEALQLYETRKMTLKLPADLYEAIRLASKAEHKTQNQLVVDILTSALAKIPEDFWEN